ncbi:uncharacterized protein LAJ45_10245 [Morchella importuna]|uniref:uncharacterized protein n=1 Tax=Morchella importuna TaxID=1174673 RepID=UPI001E8D5E8D|nr:uncharacterized protein LAJ45_10245 [Morchella importuna]KAH8145768.1 hypothetical protein LAJ45_10245 [Morchella importuna]
MPSLLPPPEAKRAQHPLASRGGLHIHKRPLFAPYAAPYIGKRIPMAIYTVNVNTYHTNRARFEVEAAESALVKEQMAWVLYKNKYEKCGKCGSWGRRLEACEGGCRAAREEEALRRVKGKEGGEGVKGGA